MSKSLTYKLTAATLFDGRQQPWRSVALPWSTFPIPSMICDDEVRFLYYLTSCHYRGKGSIVDMGPLAGGSTYAMAAGMTGGRIHSYDLWRYCPGFEPYFGRMRESADLLPAFRANLAKYAKRITPHPGDILEQNWTAGAIELMFIDAAKSPALMHHIANEYFPHLMPGAYVVHQDFVSAEDPWIHVAMGILGEHFEVVDSPDGGSVCFRVVKPIPAHPLPAGYLEGQRHHIRAARQMFSSWHGLCLELAEAHYLAFTGYPAEARAMLDTVRKHSLYEPARYAYDVKLVERLL